jgi:hypothetical protein
MSKVIGFGQELKWAAAGLGQDTTFQNTYLAGILVILASVATGSLITYVFMKRARPNRRRRARPNRSDFERLKDCRTEVQALRRREAR